MDAKMPPHPNSLHGLRPADIEWLATRAAEWMGRAIQCADMGDADAAYAWARDAAHYAIVVLEARRLAIACDARPRTSRID